jgi:hypothetical protein
MLNLDRFLALTLIVAACGDKDAGDSDSATDSATDSAATEPTDGEAADPACACVDPAQFGHFSYTCDRGPCDSVAVECDDEGEQSDPACGGSELVSLDETALNCALDVLISGKPGFVEHSSLTYISSSGAWLQVSAAGALTRSFGVYDLGGSEGAVGLVKLKSKAYFEGCKAEPDVQQRYLCFTAWTDDEPAALCDEPGEPPSEL